jgi:hypothetical protein
MVWKCQRGCGPARSKLYSSPEKASHFAVVLDHEDQVDLGRRAPLFGLFPLRVWHALRRRSRQ